MRVLLVLALVLVLSLAGPVAAGPTNLHRYGIGTRGGDLNSVTNSELLIAGANHWHIRAGLDASHLAAGDYQPKLDLMYQSGITFLPIITYNGHPGPWSSAEQQRYITFTSDVVYLMNYIAAVRGKAQWNVVEFLNEPNCSGSGFPDVASYYNGAYGPGAFGARAVDPDINLIVGGLAFGTTGSNGCHDAHLWIADWKLAGYESITNGYSIHPYGYTNSTWAREATSLQTVGKASAEESRADMETTKSILATEVGRRTDVFTQSQQQGYLGAIVANPSGVGEAALLSNWTGQDAPAGGIYTSGLLDTSGAGKLAYGEWATHNGGALVGNLTP